MSPRHHFTPPATRIPDFADSVAELKIAQKPQRLEHDPVFRRGTVEGATVVIERQHQPAVSPNRLDAFGPDRLGDACGDALVDQHAAIVAHPHAVRGIVDLDANGRRRVRDGRHARLRAVRSGGQARHRHLPDHRRIDRAPRQKQREKNQSAHTLRTRYNRRTLPAETDIGGPGVRFGETLWTAVLRARDRAAPDFQQALEWLVGAYWKPVYFFIRRRGFDVETAKDLTQSFFARFLDEDVLKNVERGRGRFRSYLLGAVSHFLSHERDRAAAQKRGGDRVRMDFAKAETELSTRGTAEQAYERAWALEVIRRAKEALATERPVWFDVLRRQQTGAAYGDIALALGIAEGNVTNYLHRARARLRELIVAEVARTVGDPVETEDEVDDLFRALKG